MTKIIGRLQSDISALLALSDTDLESEAALHSSDQGEDTLGCLAGLSRIRHMLESCGEAARQSALSTILADILKARFTVESKCTYSHHGQELVRMG